VLGNPIDIELKSGVRGGRGFGLGGLGLGGRAEGACGGPGFGGRRGKEGVDEGTVGGSAELADDEAHLEANRIIKSADRSRTQGEGSGREHGQPGLEAEERRTRRALLRRP
jgi:hypothetical protein